MTVQGGSGEKSHGNTNSCGERVSPAIGRVGDNLFCLLLYLPDGTLTGLRLPQEEAGVMSSQQPPQDQGSQHKRRLGSGR